MSYYITEQCVACRKCLDACQEQGIYEDTGLKKQSDPFPVFVIDAERCTDCGLCMDICPVDAIQYESI